MTKEKTYRDRLIGLIHMQKSAACLTDEEYRAIIAGSTGRESCVYCSIQELLAIHRDLNAVLIKQGKKGFTFYSKQRSSGKSSIQDAVIARAKKVLGESWEERLKGFLQKLNKTSVYKCTDKEVRQIMGWISTVERKDKANG